MVRPFAMVSGRTRATLPLESQVRTTEAGRQVAEQLRYELGDVVRLCLEPRSVAEVAALLAIPLAVARILVADAQDSGFVIVSRTSDPRSTAFLEEVLHALRP
jgi:hypothetical protein